MRSNKINPLDEQAFHVNPGSPSCMSDVYYTCRSIEIAALFKTNDALVSRVAVHGSRRKKAKGVPVNQVSTLVTDQRRNLFDKGHGGEPSDNLQIYQQIVQGNMLPLGKNMKTAQKFLSCRTATKPVFPSLSSMKDHLTQFFRSRETLTHANAYGPLVTQGVYRSYANYRTKISNIFWGMFGYCAVFSNLYVFIPPFHAKTLTGKHSSTQHISFIFKTHAFRLYISLSTFNVKKISNNTETIRITGS